MRFSLSHIALAVALSHKVGATPVDLAVRQVDSCNAGTIQCCNRMESSTNPLVNTISGLLGVVLNLGNGGGLVGLHCSPIAGIGAAGTGCSQQTVCCSGNTYGPGILTIGCIPLNVVL
ncbi:fungal hydrophobin [Coprinopsis marcescibilis]|uniref:Hydrophobin n=1 Tax=Coprinopsis marcescibilis TaxID=230819 RepID=A0A5C3LBJ0_COPMA|nr:fungal hydrophobin [Coprinopsis marcescibilis]